jgi:hypothetical protein
MAVEVIQQPLQREYKSREAKFLGNPVAKLTYTSILRMYGLEAAQRYADAASRRDQQPPS